MAIVICGTQRSGTSLTASFLRECGFDVGSDLWHEDINGGLEHLVACTAFRNILGDPTFPFRGFPYVTTPGVIDQFCHATEPVIKFSFLLMNPILVFLWHKYRSNRDALLILKRPTKDVVRSKERGQSRFAGEDIGDSVLLDQSPDQLEANFASSLQVVERLGFRYHVLEFPAFAQAPGLLFDALDALRLEGFDRNRARSVWSATFDESKIHFR